jgi:hypothetical protein
MCEKISQVTNHFFFFQNRRKIQKQQIFDQLLFFK